MWQPTSPEEYQLRNELYGVMADVRLDPDCDTLDQQLCRDMYLESRHIPFEHMGAEKMTIKIYGGLRIEEGPTFTYTNTLQDVSLIPIGWYPQYGALVEFEGVVNEYNEQEYLLLAGSVFTTDVTHHYRASRGVVSEEQWQSVKSSSVMEGNLNGDMVIACSDGIMLGSHLVFWQVFSLREIHEMAQNTDIDLKYFTKIGVDATQDTCL